MSVKKQDVVILYPYLAEKVVRNIEQNKIAFIVSKKAGKGEIKTEIETLYGVKVAKVNTEITPHGRKKAYVTLSKESSAADLATKLGML